MKHRILTVILLLAVAGGVIAQERDIQTIKPSKHSPYHNDIAIIGGRQSLYGFLFLGDFTLGPRGFMSSDKPYGNYGIQYHRNLNWWFQYGVKATSEFRATFRYAEGDRNTVAGHNSNSLWTLMPSIRFIYVNTEWVRLYSGLDMGMSICHFKGNYRPGDANNKVFTYFAFNTTPIGINVGKRIYGMFEINLGTDALLKFGLGCRF